MIPRIIHYCWFGDAPIPEEELLFIGEWTALHPDWQIQKWDHSNINSENAYLAVANASRNWANMSNYVRLLALLEYGGIYLDTDMKLLKSLDELLEYECFLGFENEDNETENIWVNNAIMGAVPGHSFVQRCLSEISMFDGTEKANLSSPHLVTNILKKYYGLEKAGEQMLGDIKLFPKEYFYSLPYGKVHVRDHYSEYTTPNSIAIHFWKRSWLSADELLDAMDSQTRFIDEQTNYIQDLSERLEHFSQNGDGDMLILKKIGDLSSSNKSIMEQLQKQATAADHSTKMLKTMESKQLLMENNTRELQTALNANSTVHDFYNQKILHIESSLNQLAIEHAVSKKENEFREHSANQKIENIAKESQQDRDKLKSATEFFSKINTAIDEKNKHVEKLSADFVTLSANTTLALDALREQLNDFIEVQKLKTIAVEADDAKTKKADEQERTREAQEQLKAKARDEQENVKLRDATEQLRKEKADVHQLVSDLNSERERTAAGLKEKSEEIEKLHFKVNTLNSYIDNFARTRKEMEDRIWLLEEIIQDMRLVNRAKRVFGGYKSKVSHLIFNSPNK